jgi:Icc protein
MSVQLGQFPDPGSVIVHLSDTHFLADKKLLYGTLDTDSVLQTALNRIESSGLRPDLVLITGDIADRGEPDAYHRIRSLIKPFAKRLGSKLLWVPGNHDDRSNLRTQLLHEAPSTRPLDHVIMVDGLRIVALDTTVPGYHHGELDHSQLEWLRAVLSDEAPRGTIVAMHHPPIPTPIRLMNVLELQRQDRLAAVLKGTDVRAILAGHLHYPTNGVFAGIPVSVAGATCYTMNLTAPEHELQGLAGGQSFNLVQVYDTQLVHSVVPIAQHEIATRFDASFVQQMEALDHAGRIEAFSRFPAG